jgi:hypothetical protein
VFQGTKKVTGAGYELVGDTEARNEIDLATWIGRD